MCLISFSFLWMFAKAWPLILAFHTFVKWHQLLLNSVNKISPSSLQKFVHAHSFTSLPTSTLSFLNILLLNHIFFGFSQCFAGKVINFICLLYPTYPLISCQYWAVPPPIHGVPATTGTRWVASLTGWHQYSMAPIQHCVATCPHVHTA